MFGDDTEYFGFAGEIITAEGNASGISDDAFVFSSSKSGKLVLLDYGHEASRKYLRERSERISGALAPFIGKNLITPDEMVSHLLRSLYTQIAFQHKESDFNSVLMDTGSFLFSQDVADSSRREEYTILDSPVTNHKKYDNITRIDTLLTTDIDSYRDRRRKIVADAVSLLSGLICQTLYSTRGRVAYAPMGSCTYVAIVDRLVVLIVNDPLGEGWRLVPEGTVDFNQTGELMEFSTKLVIDSLFSRKVKKRVNVLSSGTITTAGDGMVTTVTRDEIEQVPLVEGRISIGFSSSNNTVTVNVSPIPRDSSRDYFSPSIFSWFDIKMNGIVPESTPKNDGHEDSQLPFVRNEACAKRNKKCRIAERGDWSDQLLRLDRFVKRSAEAVDFMEEKMRNLSEVIGDSATRNILLVSREPQSSAADAAYALTDFNDDDGDERRTLLSVLEYDKNVVSLTVIGNAPTNGQTMRVVRLLKKMSGNTAESPPCPNGCKWYNTTPASMMTMGTSKCHSNGDDLVRMDPVFVYTPRCVYHSKTAYVHLYSDNEGPLYDIKFSEDDDVLAIEGVNNNLLDVNKPLAIGAVTMAIQRNIDVVDETNKGERMSAKPLKLFASVDKAKDIVHFVTKETGGEEFMNGDMVRNLKWYQTVSGGSDDMPGPPDCLLKRIDDRGKIMNIALTQIIKEGGDAGECVKREEVVNFMDTKYNKTKYPSPFENTLVKYGIMAANAAEERGGDENTIINVALIL